MVNVLAGHYLDYNNAAIDFWGAQDFKGAYDAWTILLSMPKTTPLPRLFLRSVSSPTRLSRKSLSTVVWPHGRLKNSTTLSLHSTRQRAWATIRNNSMTMQSQ